MIKSLPRATVSLAMAKAMTAAAESKASEINVPVVISIVDGGANPLIMQRMDEAFVTSCDISLNKAWSACSLPISSELLFLAVVSPLLKTIRLLAQSASVVARLNRIWK